MLITSTAFSDSGMIPATYTCKGSDINPPLQISEVPEETQSLVLIVDDPDAPAGTWIHWTMWNIDPNTKQIDKDSIPENAVQGTTSAKSIGYHGPCPPSGIHRYFFKLFALDAKLDLQEGASIEELKKIMEDHVLKNAELVGKFGS